MEIDSTAFRSSDFNVFVEPANGTPHLLLNTYSRAIVALTEAEMAMLARSLSTDMCELPAAYLRALASQGFVVPTELPERSRFLHSYSASMYDTRHTVLTIFTTLRCNLACRYCYQNREDLDLTMDVASQIVERVRERRPYHLHVTWMGGEPLLCCEVIDHLSSILIKSCEHYTASIVTNGTLLTRESLELLNRSKVASAQITLDGPAEFHDMRRPFADGSPSFQSVVEGIRLASSQMQVLVRINADSAMLAQSDTLQEFMRSTPEILGPRAQVYISPVLGVPNRRQTERYAVKSYGEFASSIEKLYTQLISEGWKGAIPDLRPARACGAIRSEGVVVAPDGSLYKCWDEPSWAHEVPIGHVSRPWRQVKELSQEMRFLDYRTMYRPECMRCSMQPMCAGGCPRKTLADGRRSIEEEVCNRTKSWIPAVARIRYHLRRGSAQLVTML